MTDIPDVVGTVRGYRAWHLQGDGQLRSSGQHYVWEPGVNTARCAVQHPYKVTYDGNFDTATFEWQDGGDRWHVVPVFGCTCGFYACTNPDADEIYGGVYGVVEMSGGIVVHEKNTVIRAQKARIAAVSMSRLEYKRSAIRAVRELYPGVEIFRDKEALLAAHPPAEPRTPKRRKRQHPFFLAALGGGGLGQLIAFAITRHPENGGLGGAELALGGVFAWGWYRYGPGRR